MTVPKARVLTGGVQALISHAVDGTIAEMLVAADLLARGWHVYSPFVRQRGHDLIAVKGEKIVTIEVRSAYRGIRGLCFNRQPHDNSMVYALVVTGEPVMYRPAELID